MACISPRDPEYQFYLPPVCSDAESSISTEQETVDGLAALKNGYVGMYGIQCVGLNVSMSILLPSLPETFNAMI